MSDAPSIQVLDAGHVPDGPDSDFDPLALAREQEAAEGGPPAIQAKGKSQTKPQEKSTPNVDLSAGSEEEDAPLDDGEPDEEQADPEEFELKANGKAYKVKGIEGLKAAAQRGIAALQAQQKDKAEFQKGLAELKRLTAEAKARMEMSPEELFKAKYGEKAEDAMEGILLKRAQEAAELADMTPRERDLYLARKADQQKLSVYEQEKKAQEAKADEELVKTQRSQIEGVFSEALTKHGLPVTNATVRIMAAVYRSNLDAGNKMDAAQAAEATKKQISVMFSEVAKSMKPADFVAQYPDLAKAIRAHFIQAKQGAPVGDPAEAPPRRAVTPTKRKAPTDDDAEWHRKHEALIKQGDRDLQRLNNNR